MHATDKMTCIRGGGKLCALTDVSLLEYFQDKDTVEEKQDEDLQRATA